MSDETQVTESSEAGWGTILSIIIVIGIIMAGIPDWLEGWTIIGRLIILVLTTLIVAVIFFGGNISGLTKAIYCFIAFTLFGGGWSAFSSDGIFKKAVLAGDVEMVREVISDDKDILQSKFGKNAIQEAASSGHANIVKLLIDSGVDAERAIDGGKEYENAIYLAISNNHPNVIKTIRDSGKYNVDQWVDLHNTHLEESRIAEAKQAEARQLQQASSLAKDAAIMVAQSKVKSPSSFKLINHKLLWQGTNDKGEPSFISKIKFDADNSFGTSVRNCWYVAFSLDENVQVLYHPDFAVNSCESNSQLAEPKFINLIAKTNFNS